MSDFIQPESPLNLNIGATQFAKNSGHDRIIPENISCEAETRAETTQEEVNKLGDMPPEEPSEESLDAENVGQTGEIETNQGVDRVLEEKNQDEQPSSLGAETISKIIVPPRKHKRKIKNLRKEQQRLWKLVKRLRRKIRKLATGKAPDKTPETINATVQTKLHKIEATGTQTEPILTELVREQHAILVEAATQTEAILSHDLAIQTEMVPSYSTTTQTKAWASHNKETQTIGIHSHNRSTQKNTQAKDIIMSNDPSIVNLQEYLAKAQLTIERVELETISQQKYQEL